jgi:hypothetical protein
LNGSDYGLEKVGKVPILGLPEGEYLHPGSYSCPGCGEFLALRHVLKALAKKVILVIPAGCIPSVAGLFPRTAFKVSVLNIAFEVRARIYVSGDLWENYIGAAGWTENDPLVSLDALKRYYDEEHFDAQVAVKAARSQGRRVAELAILIKAGALQFLEKLKKDDMYVAFVERLQR